MADKIFAVRIKTDAGETLRLVEAGKKHVAHQHVVNEMVSVEVADQQTLVAAIQSGIKVEKAAAE